MSNSAKGNGGKIKEKTFVPYRDSTLTWLLKVRAKIIKKDVKASAIPVLATSKNIMQYY